jgi:multisubunit Na+/H+ antiporter MnhG subunit
MNRDVKSRLGSFRGSARAWHIGSSIFVAMIVLYLAVITYSLSDRLDSTKMIVALIFFWLIGIVALALILRAHRRATLAE